MMKKYRILKDDSIEFNHHILYRIVSLKEFSAGGCPVKAGEKGGYIQSEINLSQKGKCWVYPDAKAMDNARVCDNAVVWDKGIISGNSIMLDDSAITDNATVTGNCCMQDLAYVSMDADVRGHVVMIDDAYITDDAVINGDVTICERASIRGHAVIKNTDSHILIGGNAVVDEHARISDSATIYGFVRGESQVYGNAIVEKGGIVDGESRVSRSTRINWHVNDELIE